MTDTLPSPMPFEHPALAPNPLRLLPTTSEQPAPITAQYVAAYTRISDDRTGEDGSRTRQRREIRELAEHRGIDPDTLVWFDEEKSATKGPRPEFDRLIAAILRGEVLLVLTWVSDRFWRTEDDRIEVSKIFRKANLKLAAVKGNEYDFTTAEGRFTGKVVGAASEFEIERKQERVDTAIKYRAEKGRFSGGVRPFGYQQRDTRLHRSQDEAGNISEVVRPSGPLELVPKEAEAIADAYRMIISGVGLNAVTREWRKRGLTGVQGGKIVPTTVRDILLRPTNAGISVHRGKIAGKAEWPAIVDAETWSTVKAILEDPIRRTTKSGRPPTHILTGILRCGTCGGPLRASNLENYRCRSGRELLKRKKGIHAARRRNRIEDAFTEELLRRIMKNATRVERPAPANQSPVVLDAIKEAAGLRAQKKAYEAQAALFDPESLASIFRNLDTQLAKAEQKIIKAAGKPATLALVQHDDPLVRWASMSVADQRAVILEQVEKIVVGPGISGGRGPAMHNIKIHWRKD